MYPLLDCTVHSVDCFFSQYKEWMVYVDLLLACPVHGVNCTFTLPPTSPPAFQLQSVDTQHIYRARADTWGFLPRRLAVALFSTPRESDAFSLESKCVCICTCWHVSTIYTYCTYVRCSVYHEIGHTLLRLSHAGNTEEENNGYVVFKWN